MYELNYFKFNIDLTQHSLSSRKYKISFFESRRPK